MVKFAEEILRAWNALRENLEKVSAGPQPAGDVALDLLHVMREFEKGGNRSVLYCPYAIVEKDGSYDEALTIKPKGDDGIIVLTPQALSSREGLVRVLAHELLHVAGAVSDDEVEDEAIAEYLTGLLLPEREHSASTHAQVSAAKSERREVPQSEFEGNVMRYLSMCVEVIPVKGRREVASRD